MISDPRIGMRVRINYPTSTGRSLFHGKRGCIVAIYQHSIPSLNSVVVLLDEPPTGYQSRTWGFYCTVLDHDEEHNEDYADQQRRLAHADKYL